MTERSFRPDFESYWVPEYGELEEVTDEMTRLLAVAVNSRQAGEPIEVFAPKQAEATNFIKKHWPGDKLLHISFSHPAELFLCDGEFQAKEGETTVSFQANRHAGFGYRGALFVNDMENKSVYVSEFFSTELDFIADKWISEFD